MRGIRLARSQILPWNADTLSRAGVAPDHCTELLQAVTPETHGEPAIAPRRSREKLALKKEVLRQWPGFKQPDDADFRYEMTSTVVETTNFVAQVCASYNDAAETADRVTSVAVIWGKFDNELIGAFLIHGTILPDRDDALPIRNWIYEDPRSEELIDAKLTWEAIGESDYLRQRRDGTVQDLKLAHMLRRDDLAARPEHAGNPLLDAENFDYRTAMLAGVADGGLNWKCLMSNPILPTRQRSAAVLVSRLTNRLIGVGPCTDTSGRRTAANVSWGGKTFMAADRDLNVHMMGAGPIAPMVLDTMDLTMSHQIGRVTVNSTGISAFRMVDAWNRSAERSIDVSAMMPPDEDTLAQMDADAFVLITANPKLKAMLTRKILTARKIKSPVRIIDLSIASLEPELVMHVLSKGKVICDEVHTVFHRDAQSISNVFTRAGLDMEKDRGKWDISDICDITGPITGKDVLYSASGLASTDEAVTFRFFQKLAELAGVELRV